MGLAIRLKEFRFFAYALLSSSTVIFFTSQSGLIRLLPTENQFEMYNSRIYGISVSLFIMSVGIYLYELLEFKKNPRQITAILTKIISAAGFSGFAISIGAITYNGVVGKYIVFSIILYGSSLPFIQRRHNKETTILLISWLFLFIHAAIFTAYVRDILPLQLVRVS